MATHLPDGLSADAVDTLTELTSIITRLRSAQQQPPFATSTSVPGPTSGPAGPSTATPGNNAQPTGTTPLPGPGSVTGTTPASNTPSGAGAGAAAGSAQHHQHPQAQLLSAKELPAATDNLKHKLQRARVAMRALPDIQRSIAQQEAEMAVLGARRQAQAERLAQTHEDGLVFFRAEGQIGDGDGDRMVE